MLDIATLLPKKTAIHYHPNGGASIMSHKVKLSSIELEDRRIHGLQLARTCHMVVSFILLVLTLAVSSAVLGVIPDAIVLVIGVVCIIAATFMSFVDRPKLFWWAMIPAAIIALTWIVTLSTPLPAWYGIIVVLSICWLVGAILWRLWDNAVKPGLQRWLERRYK